MLTTLFLVKLVLMFKILRKGVFLSANITLGGNNLLKLPNCEEKKNCEGKSNYNNYFFLQNLNCDRYFQNNNLITQLRASFCYLACFISRSFSALKQKPGVQIWILVFQGPCLIAFSD